MIDINYYKFPDGSNPIDPWLDSLEKKMKAKVLRTIGLLKEYGSMLQMPHSRFLEDGILELRIRQGNNIERVLYFFFYDDANCAVLTNGFTKKSQKTPSREIQFAKKRRADYIRRHENG